MNDAIDLLDGDLATRSADGRKVEEIIPVSGNVASKTRSGETTTVWMFGRT